MSRQRRGHRIVPAFLSSQWSTSTFYTSGSLYQLNSQILLTGRTSPVE